MTTDQPLGEQKKITVNFQMEADLHEQLKALAKKKGISFAGFIRMLGIEALEAEQAKKA